jgi:hypothetical protein
VGDEALERLLVGKPGMRVEELQLAGVVRNRAQLARCSTGLQLV